MNRNYDDFKILGEDIFEIIKYDNHLINKNKTVMGDGNQKYGDSELITLPFKRGLWQVSFARSSHNIIFEYINHEREKFEFTPFNLSISSGLLVLIDNVSLGMLYQSRIKGEEKKLGRFEVAEEPDKPTLGECLNSFSGRRYPSGISIELSNGNYMSGYYTDNNGEAVSCFVNLASRSNRIVDLNGKIIQKDSL